jgi:hypothetical protein
MIDINIQVSISRIELIRQGRINKKYKLLQCKQNKIQNKKKASQKNELSREKGKHDQVSFRDEHHQHNNIFSMHI